MSPSDMGACVSSSASSSLEGLMGGLSSSCERKETTGEERGSAAVVGVIGKRGRACSRQRNQRPAWQAGLPIATEVEVTWERKAEKHRIEQSSTSR